MLKGNQIYLKPLDSSHAEALLDMEVRNRDFFEQYTITRENDFYTMETQLERLQEKKVAQEEDKGYHFGIFLSESSELIGEIGLFRIERGPAECGMVGYSLDKKHNGNGYMTEAIRLIVDYAFTSLKLHRIEAGAMPRNSGSIKVLEKSGFHKEGIARSNVNINGNWEDHQMLAIINPDN
ncbi:GNAT family N-acetyltransferase [Virgibacillus sp. DJP39]|uniref:GNAT family N-acetyltransferase n=1 Tax=Virgibacillus sp. DJP39 TaxID=3409790 RepID=UPI003BB6F179